MNGAYISPYYGGLNDPQGRDRIYCIDPDDQSKIHTSWDVYVTQLDTNTDLTNTYLGNSGRTVYEKIAWLLFDATVGGKTYDQMSVTDQRNIQGEVWYLVDPFSQYSKSNSYWAGQAQSNYQSGDYSNIFILSEDCVTRNQEFMIKKVPEPSTIMLLGCGLFGLVTFRKKFIKISRKPRSVNGDECWCCIGI